MMDSSLAGGVGAPPPPPAVAPAAAVLTTLMPAAVIPPMVTATVSAPPQPPGPKREVRRCSDPARSQNLWDAIKAVRMQKQIPAITRMSRYMNRFYQVKKDETQRLLNAAVEDNLIKLEKKVGTKGAKSGVEESAYRLPSSDMLPRERHDWYCFHCHSGGEVVLCDGCHRVYHESCIKPPMTDDEEEGHIEWFCQICKTCQAVPEAFTNRRDRKDLNHLLRILCKKLREKMPHSLMDREIPKPPIKNQDGDSDRNSVGGDAQASPLVQPGQLQPLPLTPKQEPPEPQKLSLQQLTPGTPGLQLLEQQDLMPPAVKPPPPPKKPQEEDESWRVSFLLKQKIDLSDIEDKCNSNQYRVVDEYMADAQLYVHCVVIYHGAHSTMADKARQILRDCTVDLKEIAQCRDCYRYSNDNREKYWFCKPCRPFHELVYAKQKGFPYWPAKVMSSKDNIYEVRFFGLYHQKAIVEKGSMKGIGVNIHTLQVKRTSPWNKACEELRKHQELLAKVKQNESEFLKDPYGDPFNSEDIKAQLKGDDDSSDSDSGSEDSDLEDRIMQQQQQQNNRTFEMLHSSPPPPVSAPPTPAPLPLHPVSSAILSPPSMMQQQKPGLKKMESFESAAGGSSGGKKGKKKFKREDEEGMVSSSSQESRFANASVQTLGGGKMSKKELAAAAAAQAAQTETNGGSAAQSGTITEDELKAVVERMRAEFDQEKKRAVNVATRSLERDLERLKADHATEIEEILDNQKEKVSEIKKKQWCFKCESEAMYWCCWNTAYCSIPCQQKHWHQDHKKSCRRKQ